MARGSASSTSDGYVDIYLLPIPERNVEAYRQQATLFGKVARECGALRYREFRGDDLADMNRMSPGGFETFVSA